MEGKVAVLGDADFVLPFSALGVDTYSVEQSAEQISESANEIIGNKYTLVIVSEETAPMVEEIFSDYQGAPTPCIVVVPFTAEPTGAATKTLGEALKMATGINILQND